jgi:hypothetical protein
MLNSNSYVAGKFIFVHLDMFRIGRFLPGVKQCNIFSDSRVIPFFPVTFQDLFIPNFTLPAAALINTGAKMSASSHGPGP